MLRVELYQSIRNAVNKEGHSIRATAKEFKVHRRDVRQALACAIPRERKSAPKVRPKLGAYESTVRAWLTEDLKVPKKQQHSATRIWQRLIDECGTFGRNTQLLFLAEDPVGNRSQPSHSPQTFPRAYQYHTQPFRVSPKARELRLSAVVRSQALRLASPTLGCINSVPCGVGGPRRGYPVEFT